MPKPTTTLHDATEPVPEGAAWITYVGPPEHESPTFGPLVAGRRYQMAADLAAYLCATHPDYWQAAPQSAKE